MQALMTSQMRVIPLSRSTPGWHTRSLARFMSATDLPDWAAISNISAADVNGNGAIGRSSLASLPDANSSTVRTKPPPIE